MLTGILFLIVVIAVAVLVAVDVSRTPTEGPAAQPDRHVHAPEPVLVGARAGAGVRAFPREPAVPDKPVPPADGNGRLGAAPAGMDSPDRPDKAAGAFDQMHRGMSPPTASDAALRGKFNAMYVTLSRRSQTLVERQLRIIDSLEHGERDAERLAGLSKLNRIAMRMHRNSQNLLVLAGQEPVVQWNQPVTLAHIVEAALAEIEDSEHVSFEVQPDIAVRGPAVHDAVHVLVELLDNAASFSAAEMPVYVTGRILTSGGALVDITDRGIGMTAKEMAYANHQLDNPPPPDIEVPKWMGLLVVARLAARHGIRVRLNQAELGGLTALVWFPDEILTHGAAAGPGLAADQRAAVVSPEAFTPTRMPREVPVAVRSDPAWSARGSQATLEAEPAAAARRAGAGRTEPDLGVVVPHPDSQAGPRGLPIFDEVESHWSRGGREAPKSAGLAAAPAPATAAPAAPGPAAGPAAPGPATGGLPRRPTAAAQGSRTVAGTPPSAPNRSGGPGRQSWAAPGEEANPGAQNES